MLAQEVVSILSFAVIVGIGFVANIFVHRLDVKPLRIQDEPNRLGQFIAERAYMNLKVLNDFGPKVVGSDVNEILAFNFIFNHLNEIRNASQKQSDITVDHQVVSGVNYVHDVYKNIQNIVVRVQGQTDHALMLNCHYDSVAGSPGASDDIVMCCIMIEFIRLLSLSEGKQRHSIVFLFNGFEEGALQGAHGFITQHQWAKDVRAFINLESTGSGGREILFQSGPKHDWMVRLYRESVPRPYGNAVAEEMFQLGVIPSGTDFEIFTGYGEVPGLDFAYVKDGWRYHTRYDSIDYIPMESVQYTGENIYALMLKMANSNELENPPEGSYAIYFDYLGLFFISYSIEVGVGVNITISLLAIIIPMLIHTKLKKANVKHVVIGTLFSFITILLSTVLSAAACYLMAMIMNAADNTMSYFNTTFLSIGIYGSLALIVQIAVYHLMQFLSDLCMRRGKREEKSKAQVSKSRWTKIQLAGVNLFWACLTLTITILGYRAAFVFMIILFISLCTEIITETLFAIIPTTKNFGWIIFHLLGQSVSFIWICYTLIQLWELFIPITAKQYYANPDIIIGLICTFWTISMFSYFIPLTTLVKHRAMLYSSLIALFIVSLILSFTSFGFPYTDKLSSPKLQRFRIMQTHRKFYDAEGTKTFDEIGFLLSTIDRNSVRTLETTFGKENLQDWREDDKCAEMTFCGFGFYRFNDGRYLKSFTDPLSVKPATFTVLRTERDQSNPSRLKVEFTLDVKMMTIVYVTPGDGWKFVEGSLPTSQRTWNGKPFQLTLIAYGKRTEDVMEEFIVLEDSAGADPLNAMTITLAVVESVFEKNNDYKRLMQTFPKWTFAMEHQVDVSSYAIKEN